MKRMRYFWFALTVVGLVTFALSGCDRAGTGKSTATSKSGAQSGTTQSTEPQSEHDRLRGVKIKQGQKIADKYQKNSDLMFHIMAGEIAGHRKKLKQSVEHYLKATEISSDPRLAQRATRIALFARDNKAALEAATKWAKHNPKSPEPYRFMAVLHIRNKHNDKALEALKQYFERLNTPINLRFATISRLLQDEKNSQAAMFVFRGLIKDHSDNPYALYTYGNFAVGIKQYNEAIRAAELALKLKPMWPEAKLLQARVLVLQGYKDKAIAEMERVVRAHPKSKELRVSYARLLTQAKRYKDAQKQFEKILRQSPNDTDILYALSILALEAKQLKVAERYLKRMIRTGNRQPESYYYLGRIAEQRRHYDAAISWLSKVRKGDLIIDSHLRIATIMSKKGDVEAARRFLYQLKPRTKQLEIRLYVTEADILQRAKRYSDALDVINNALTSNPNNDDLLYTRAMMAEKLGRIDIVEKDLKIILKKNPKNSQALNALGYTLADRTKRYQEAYDYIRRALELSPDQAAIIDSMGWVLYRMGNHTESIKYLRKAFEMEKNAEIAAHLGEVLWVAGQQDEAKKVWERALAIDNNNKVLRATLKRFNQ